MHYCIDCNKWLMKSPWSIFSFGSNSGFQRFDICICFGYVFADHFESSGIAVALSLLDLDLYGNMRSLMLCRSSCTLKVPAVLAGKFIACAAVSERYHNACWKG